MYVVSVNIDNVSEKKEIPQTWSDVKWTRYINALTAEKRNESDVDAVLEALTDIPQYALAAMQPFDKRFILTQCAFFWNEPPTKQELPSDFAQIQIETDTWQKIIDSEAEFKRVTNEDLPQIAAAQLIIKTYTGLDIKEMQVPEAMAYWDFFFSSSLIGPNDGKGFMKHRPMTMKLQRVSKSYNPMSGLQHVMHWQKEMLPSTMKFSTRRLMSSTTRSCTRRTKPTT